MYAVKLSIQQWHTVQKNAEFIDSECERNVVDSFCVGVFNAES